MNKKAEKYLLESLEGFRYCRKDAETSMKGSSVYSKLIVSHLHYSRARKQPGGIGLSFKGFYGYS